MQYLRPLMALRRDETGVTALEYGLIAALIAMAVLTAYSALSANLSSMFNSIAGHLG